MQWVIQTQRLDQRVALFYRCLLTKKIVDRVADITKHHEGNEGDQKKHEYRLAEAPKNDQKHSAMRLSDPNTCGIQAR